MDFFLNCFEIITQYVVLFRGIDQNTYSSNEYPGFCHGPMYTLQRPIMDDLYTMSKWTRLGGFYLEDVYITGEF